MANFSSILTTKARISFEFENIVRDETRSGEPLVILVLKEPISRVMGRRITDRLSGESARLQVNDVTEIQIGPDDMENIRKLEEESGKSIVNWIEEGKSGTIETDQLLLDVDRRDKVWLRRESLAAYGRKQADSSGRTVASIIDRMQKRAAESDLKQVSKDLNEGPEIVATAEETEEE